MKKLLLIIAMVPALCFAQTKKQKKAQLKADKITLTNLQTNIQYLADDKLEGRRAGTPGELLAMQYISAQFAKIGLAPKGADGYIQEFDIDEGRQFTADNNSFSVNDKQLELKKDFFPLSYSGNGTAAGFVSTALQEKAEPWFFDVKDVVEENKGNPHFDINTILLASAKHAMEKGGKALIVFNSAHSVDNIQFNKNDATAAVTIPIIYITADGLKKFFDDETDTYEVKLTVTLTHPIRKARNVVGFLNFNAPTTIIVGAHYDHLGYGEDGNSLDGLGQIHNGADDNASGTAAMIEMARILQKTPAHNNNYLFIAFSAEELGLFGSKHWLEKPSVNIVPNYMLNMDMVGRYDTTHKLTVGGYGTSPVWGTVFNNIHNTNLIIKFDSSGSGPSDHASFYRKDIPVLFFFTNSHSDYHKASDDWDKINYAGEVQIVNLINTIIEATDAKGKLPFTKTRDQEARSVALPVTLGVIPDYGFSGTGMRIDGVSKGKAAERAGLQAGDILLQLGDYKFVDVQSYMQALQHFKKGDSSVLKIKRADKEMEFNIQF
ncbi:M28 family peptidase [Limnovirga soli]|uniref:M28 family peptidase n=1 Tax=Limnovirga soli TaxID=2656915 RepID=A0A8J8FHX3_9BACT|nr:M28 family peptidase [Limnovirga soli]NNV57702.1 M28 family peptidase [Limnovirga soli]